MNSYVTYIQYSLGEAVADIIFRLRDTAAVDRHRIAVRFAILHNASKLL